jgi:hypothetical protein
MAPRRRQATAEDLVNKPARHQDWPISVPSEKGDIELNLSLVALSAIAYDELMAAHPPTKDQKAEGSAYNPDTFAPALISAVVADPKMSEEQTTAIWTSETWNRGELRDLFMGCVNICSRGLDVPFTRSPWRWAGAAITGCRTPTSWAGRRRIGRS